MTINRENFATWTAALRSGEYKQAQGALKVKTDEGPLHCCLGVVCELAGLPSALRTPNGLMYTFYDSGLAESSTLPPTAREWLGVTKSHGIVFSDEETLPSLNDTGSTFEELADRIDAWVAEQA